MGQNRLILEMIQIENLYVKMEEAVFSLRGSDQYQRSTCKTLFAASTGSEISWPSDLNIVFNWGLSFFLFKTSFKIWNLSDNPDYKTRLYRL